MLLLLAEMPWARYALAATRDNAPCTIDTANFIRSKMFSFIDQVGYRKNVVDTLKSLCRCDALFYVEKWLNSSFGSDASYNDLLLQLRHDLNDYKEHDTRVLFPVQLVIRPKAFERHIWYLTEECAIFSLFSNQLPDSEQQNIVLRLNNRTPVPSSKKVRHDFQRLTTQQSSRTSLFPNLG